MPSNAPAMPKAGSITSSGWRRLLPGATRALTPGTAALDERTPPALVLVRDQGRRPITALLERKPLRIVVQLPAPPAAVFALLTDPDNPALDGNGRAARPAARRDLSRQCHRGSLRPRREVVPVHRLAYSFGWDDSEVV